VEGAIAINALANDTGFVDQMIEAHHRSQKDFGRAISSIKFAASFSAEEIANMNKAIAEADAYQALKGKGVDRY